MTGALVTRRVLARQLALNAATRPLNLTVPALVLLAALVLHTLWLLPVALAVYLAMAAATFFDGDEAERIGKETYARARARVRGQVDPRQLAAPIAAKLTLALEEEERIAQATTDRSVTDEVARLTEAVEALASSAQLVYDYLHDLDEEAIRQRLPALREAAPRDPAAGRAADALDDQLTVATELRGQLARFDAEMDQINASLSTIHGQLVRISVTETSATTELAAQVRHLRDEVTATADAMRDAHRELDPPTEQQPTESTSARHHHD